jgi:hypothetical protein
MAAHTHPRGSSPWRTSIWLWTPRRIKSSPTRRTAGSTPWTSYRRSACWRRIRTVTLAAEMTGDCLRSVATSAYASVLCQAPHPILLVLVIDSSWTRGRGVEDDRQTELVTTAPGPYGTNSSGHRLSCMLEEMLAFRAGGRYTASALTAAPTRSERRHGGTRRPK